MAVDRVEEDERFGDFPGELGFTGDGVKEPESGGEEFVVIAA
jgi:hypothetical protein